MFHLGVYGPLTAKDICDRAKMHKTKISRAVQKLADRRYLKRAPSELDRRSEILMLTERGQEVYRRIERDRRRIRSMICLLRFQARNAMF